MVTKRSPIPMDVKRQVLHEAGYRCSVPACHTILTLDMHHCGYKCQKKLLANSYTPYIPRLYFCIIGYLVLNNSIGSIIEVISMHKKDAPNADQLLLNSMEQINYLSNDFIVYIAIERLSGR